MTLLEEPVLQLEIPDEPTRAVTVQSLERRETGTGTSTFTRVVVEFGPASGAESTPEPAPTLEARVDALEREIARLRNLIGSISNASSIPRIDQLP
jgi:antitoxin component HigA of HigAB toxin-antitoxin module